VATSHEDKIKEQAQQYLEADEHVLAAFIAQPRGATTAKMGGGAGALGGRRAGKQQDAAGGAGLQLTTPMALALTEGRLVVLKVSPPLPMGKGGDVKELVSAVPMAEVDSIEIKRLLVGKVVKLTVHGSEFKLEAGGGANAKGLVDEFSRVRASA
jgi:hypothetical protein